MRIFLFIFVLFPVLLSGIPSHAQTKEDAFNAVKTGDVPSIKKYIKSRNNINVQNQDGQTLLMYAIYLKKTQIANLLLKAKADPNIPEDYLKQTPLQVSIIMGRTNMIKPLLKAGANVNAQDQEKHTALHHAVRSPHKLELKPLLQKGDPNIPNKRGVTPLHFAAWEDDTKSIQDLLEAGADPNMKDERGNTALHIISYKKSESAAQSLLRAGADPKIQNHIGETPSDWTTSKSMKTLLKKASCHAAFVKSSN